MNTKKIPNFAFQSDRYISLAVALILIIVVYYFESAESELSAMQNAQNNSNFNSPLSFISVTEPKVTDPKDSISRYSIAKQINGNKQSGLVLSAFSTIIRSRSP